MLPSATLQPLPTGTHLVFSVSLLVSDHFTCIFNLFCALTVSFKAPNMALVSPLLEGKTPEDLLTAVHLLIFLPQRCLVQKTACASE